MRGAMLFSWRSRNTGGITARAASVLAVALAASCPNAMAAPLGLLGRNGSLVSIESNAPNIIRVTLATDKDTVLAPPGYGIVAKPDDRGWKHQVTASGDEFSSDSLTLQVKAQPPPGPPTQMERYFAPSLPPVSLP